METPIFSGYKGIYSSHPRDSPDDHGFQPSWATVPQVAFEPPTYTTRDQVPRTPKRPIWEEAEERLDREAALKRVALEQKLKIQAADLDRSHYLALSSVATVWNVVSGIAGALGTGLGYAGRAVRAVNTGVVKAKGFMGSRRTREPYSPMGRRNRKKGRVQKGGSDSETESERGNGTQSMLSMPPHMVGATPRVVRQSRRMARPAPPSDSEPTNTIQPIRRGPKTPGKRLKVRFEGDSSTPGESESINAPNTPAFVFNTPKDKKLIMSKKDEFQMNVNKEKFNTWMKLLHESRWRRTGVKIGLAKFELPTKLINGLYEKRAEDPEPWKALISSHSHNGFLKRSGLVIPRVDFTKFKPRDWDREGENGVKVSSESLIQQKDGKCKICRGFRWAGVILNRDMTVGQDVPIFSQHKSVRPYTPQELQEFRTGNHSSLFRRWCQESRWDWLFEDPPLSGLNEDGGAWTIPKDDPRLRHVTRLNEITKFYDADRMDIYEGLMLELSEQDLAAKRFITAILKSGNIDVASNLREMDMERKRRQVQVKFLCVRQVQINVVGKETTKTRTRKRPANDPNIHPDDYKKHKGTAAYCPPPRTTLDPALRMFLDPTKTYGKGPKIGYSSIIPPTILEPVQKIPAPFDPVELKKIRLAPLVDDTYKSPETRFRERRDEEMRYQRGRKIPSRTYSAQEVELEAELHFENCKKAEFHRIEEEKLRAKEIEEEKARARGKSENPPKDLPNKLPEVGRNIFQFGAKGAGAPASMWG